MLSVPDCPAAHAIEAIATALAADTNQHGTYGGLTAREPLHRSPARQEKNQRSEIFD